MPARTPKEPKFRGGMLTVKEDVEVFARVREDPGPDNITFEDKTYCRRCAKMVTAMEKAACPLCQN